MLLSFPLTLCALVAVHVASAAVIAQPHHERGESLSNAERFRRGLPPKAPRRRYDPTAVRAPAARRSGLTGSGYLQVVPNSVGRKRDGQPHSGTNTTLVGRGGSPMYDTGYLYHDSSAREFISSVSTSTAQLFTWTYSGTDTYLTTSGGTEYVCLRNWAGGADMKSGAEGGSAAVYLNLCDMQGAGLQAPQTKAQAAGQDGQWPVWNIPDTLPNAVTIDYFNSDDSITADVPLWIYQLEDDDTYYFGGALAVSDFGSPVSWNGVTLKMIATLPQ